jgi:signal transduction histidine kinase/ActR/RegA family two-component response regulator
MPKKQLLNRLDGLFSELQADKIHLKVDSEPAVEYWSWECDARGVITACSDGIQSALGFTPNDFIGMQVFSYRLTPESAQNFMISLQNKESSDAQLDYIDVNGNIVRVTTNIEKQEVDNGATTRNGWRGLAQVIQPGKSPASALRTPENLEKDTTPNRNKSRQNLRRPGQHNGFLAENSHIAPADNELTPLGRESIQYQHILYQHARGNEPAVIAMPARYENENENILLEIEDNNPSRRWSEDELILIEQVADQLSLALENARLIEQTRAQADELNILRQISLELALEQRELASVIEIISRRARELLTSDGIAIWLWREADQALELSASFPVPQVDVPGFRVKRDEDIAGIAFSRQKSQIVDDYPTWSEKTDIKLINPVALSIQTAMAVPLIWQAQGIGVIVVYRSEVGYRYTPNDRHLAELLCAQAASVIQNAKLFEQSQQALEETETLYRASAELNASESYMDLLNILRKNTVLGTNSKEVSVHLYDRPWLGNDMPDWYDLLAVWSLNPGSADQTMLRTSLSTIPSASQLLHPTGPTVISDVTNDMRLEAVTREHYLKRYKSRGLIFAPLVTAGKWIGHIQAIYNQPIRFPESSIRRLNALSTQAAIVIQNMRLLEETRRRADEMQTAAEIARDSTGTLTLDDLLGRAVELIRERFNYYHVTIFLLDDMEDFAIIHAATGAAGKELIQKQHKLAVGSNSIIGYVTRMGEPLVVNDVSQFPIHKFNPLLPETKAELGIPLKIGDRITGALDVQSIKINAFSNDDVAVLQILADQLAIAVENARAYELSIQAVEEMRKADQLKSQFLANMSHELRTPLNSIIGFSRVIMKGIDGPITEVQEQDLKAIYNSGQHLLNLINDILDLSKIEAGKMELSIENDVVVADVISSVLSTATGLIKDKPIELINELNADLPKVRADPVKVRQILLNLISNAAKFTDFGTITISAVEERDSLNNALVKISVADTGQGISSEDQSKLFLPFSQIDASPSRKTGGSGLGLSICRRLVEMHGGRIGLTSEVGKGTTFYFTLLASNPESDSGQTIASESSKRILCIDDEREVVNLYKRYLNAHNFQVIPLIDPEKAVGTAARLQPMVITLDIAMPTLDGWQILQALKSDSATKHIPVIICSIIDEREKGLRLGADAYLLKPILEDDLVYSILKIVNSITVGG